VNVEIPPGKTEERGKPQPGVERTLKRKEDAVGRIAVTQHQDEVKECRAHAQ
jgi:hypothetical protein